MAMLYRPLACFRETYVFPPVRLEKPMKIFDSFLIYVIMLLRPTNTPNLIEVGSQVAPPHRGEM